MRPLRIKASGTPITSSNFQGLQEMTDAEIQQYLSATITNKFATDTDGTGAAELNVTTDASGLGTSIGTFVDTSRTESIGTHPATGATTTTTYTFKQCDALATESLSNRPVGYDSAIKEFTDNDLDTDVLDTVISDMVSESDYTVGQYKLASTAPSGGTWTSRYTITDTAQGGNTSIYLWQKTAPTSSANSDLVSLKVEGSSGVKMMSSSEVEQMVPNFRNRILQNGIGKYKLQNSTPSETGTWTQMGDAFSNTIQQVASENYAGTYTGSYAGTYAGDYTGAYSGSYTGNYVGAYTGAKNYTGSYSGAYTGAYAGTYAGTSAYAGTYAGSYEGTYALSYAGFVAAYYTGTYTGYYTGYYTGAKNYTGYYSGDYTGNYSGTYAGTSAYSGTYAGTYTGYYSGTYTGNYSGTYSGGYTGYYAGDTIQATKDTVSTVKLWLRTA